MCLSCCHANEPYVINEPQAPFILELLASVSRDYALTVHACCLAGYFKQPNYTTLDYCTVRLSIAKQLSFVFNAPFRELCVRERQTEGIKKSE